MGTKLIFRSALAVLFFNGLAFGQTEGAAEADVTDSVLVSTPAKKILSVPAFQRFNNDTIQLGENDQIVSGSYTALGQTNVYDALHSFNRRRMDHFGGHLNDSINAGLAEVRSKGFNSDLKKLYIQIDPSTLTVYWSAVVGPSEDGKCYMSVDSRGSAGGGLSAVQKQCPRMHTLHPGLEPVKLLEFNDNVLQCYDWSGNKLDTVTNVVNIQQHFYKYYDPQIGNTVALADVVKKEADAEMVLAPVAVVTTKKTAPVKTTPAVSYKKYTVKQGDTLSEIAEKYHTSASKIKKANGLRSDMIRVGQSLKIPR